jgi:hypothetical protein
MMAQCYTLIDPMEIVSVRNELARLASSFFTRLKQFRVADLSIRACTPLAGDYLSVTRGSGAHDPPKRSVEVALISEATGRGYIRKRQISTRHEAQGFLNANTANIFTQSAAKVSRKTARQMNRMNIQLMRQFVQRKGF